MSAEGTKVLVAEGGVPPFGQPGKARQPSPPAADPPSDGTV
jgi:hypothetical protein